MRERITRRDFFQQSNALALAGGAALAATAAAPGIARGAVGANDRIRIGIIGCGGRNHFLMNRWVYEACQAHNGTVVACCDIWRQRREPFAGEIEKKYGAKAKVFADYRKLLEDKDIDAVTIATPDHQHCTMLIDAVKAGKDVYIEKPIAMNMEELNAACDAVKAAGAVVQNGTHGRSREGAQTARDFIRSGKLGKIIRIEESRSFYNPYWNGYVGPEKEEDTDWKAFLMNRPDRPFDRDQHGAWMGYRDFSTGTCGGWMSHFSDVNHYIMGCGFPKYGWGQGGIYSPTSKPGRTCPDTFTGILEYPEGFTTSYTTHFGNGANDYVTIFATRGIMRLGPPDGWPNGIEPRVSGLGSEDPQKLPEAEAALENNLVEGHVENWLRCIRSREKPAANMDEGYKHGVAVLLCDMAMVAGRKMMFDPEKREIRPA
jgi:predicted dehydrogenase